MELITETTRLAELCEALRAEPWVTVDTEFMRDRTYFAKLCLVQLGGADHAVAVDPLAPGIDLGPLAALMSDENVLKVLHAARQDVEIFYHLMGKRLPSPLYDTQIAAMVCGYGDEVGYETLVSKLAKQRLDKSSRFTDWSKRPLTKKQLAYAIGDVTHLRVIYEKLERRIEREGRSRWVAEETGRLLRPDLYENPPEDAWRRLKFRSREGRFVACAKRLAAWREEEAQRRDLPRSRVLKDEVLLEIAAQRPDGIEALRDLPRVSLSKNDAAAVAAVIEDVRNLAEDELERPPAPEKPQKGVAPIVDLLRVLLKMRCEEHDVAPKLIATTSDLEAIAMGEDSPALEGWRRELFGADALALRDGRLALAIRDRKAVALEAADPEPT